MRKAPAIGVPWSSLEKRVIAMVVCCMKMVTSIGEDDLRVVGCRERKDKPTEQQGEEDDDGSFPP